MNYWLIKSEGDCYGIKDLKKDKKTAWTGIRNYQARNFMMRDMAVGDLVLFYHSITQPIGIYGIAKVASTPHVDETQFDAKDMHYDPKATKEKPIWHCVDMAFVKEFKEPLSLVEIKRDPKMNDMLVCKTGSRLSIQPVSQRHFEYITELLG